MAPGSDGKKDAGSGQRLRRKDPASRTTSEVDPEPVPPATLADNPRGAG